MSEPEEEEKPYYENFDFAIFSIFTALVFEIGARFGQDRQKMERSDYWGKKTKKKSKLNNGMMYVRRAALQAIGLSLLVIIASAICVSLGTDVLEERMKLILNGLSSITACIVFGSLSFGIAVWTGLYYRVWTPVEPATSRSIKELQFKVRCGYYRIFARYGFFLLPFYEGVTALTIPVSAIGGVAVGLGLGFGIYLARRKGHGCWQKCFKCIVVLGMAIISSLFLANAAWYIASVWTSEQNEDKELMMAGWWGVFFMFGFFGLAIMHAARYYISCRHMRLEEEQSGSSPVKKSASASMMSSNRPRMAASLIFEVMSKPKHDTEQPSSLKSLPIQENGGEEEEDGEEEDGDVEKVVSEEPAIPAEESASPGDKQGALDMPSKNGDDDHHDDNQKQEQKLGKGNSSIEEDGQVKDPSYKEMLAKQCICCGCLRGTDVPVLEKAWACLSWTVWLFLVGVCLYLVAINIGATQQQSAARAKFPEVNRILYSTMDLGPVCAFDNKGADSNITTFADKDAAHAAGFLIVHCGACAACSDWHNLRLEYTTRNTLAQDSRKCAQKSLTPGGRNAVLECMMAEPIEFQGKCAECWTDDVLCAKKHCALIFMQSTLINAVSDLQVNDRTITSAACEEANCEAGNPGDFVVCSGATRRRMNVTSDIARPGGQRCSIVDVNWAELFPGEE